MSKNKEIRKTKMIKTLRITSIIAAVLAVGFFVFPAVFGFCSDEQIDEFLSLPGTIEKFDKARGDKAKRSESQISPLAKQAEAFASYLNPPKLRRTAAASRVAGVTPPRPKTVSVKFELIAISFYASHPELSLALIDELGKGSRWVRQSGKVGHLVIEQIKDGLVVVRDGERTIELEPTKRLEKRSLLEGVSSGGTGFKPSLSALGRAGADVTRRPHFVVSGEMKARDIPPQASDEERASLEELIRGLKGIQASFESGKAGLGPDDKEKAVLMGGLISDLKATRISAEEAKRLGHLGEELESIDAAPDGADIQRDPNRAKDDRAKIEASAREPNSPDER